jgi:hypothetical protein
MIAARVQILSVTSDLSVPGERCFERGGQVHDLLELGPGRGRVGELDDGRVGADDSHSVIPPGSLACEVGKRPLKEPINETARYGPGVILGLEQPGSNSKGPSRYLPGSLQTAFYPAEFTFAVLALL